MSICFPLNIQYISVYILSLWKSLDGEDVSVIQVLAQEAQFMTVNQQDESAMRLKNMTIEDVDGQSSSDSIYQATIIFIYYLKIN